MAAEQYAGDRITNTILIARLSHWPYPYTRILFSLLALGLASLHTMVGHQGPGYVRRSFEVGEVVSWVPQASQDSPRAKGSG